MILLALQLALPASAASLPPKQQIVTHIRESFGVPPQVPLDLSDPKPSGVSGMDSATLTIGAGEQSQKQPVYFSKDGRHYFMAEAQDLKVQPDASRRAKISLEGAMSKGPKDAPVTIVEYSDFECPYCGKAQPDLEKSLEPYKDKVRLVFKTFPLEHMHPWAKNAAIGARCAARQKPEAFWTFADGYFAAQKDITAQNVRAKSLELAGKAGLDAKAFEACYDKAETAAEIQADEEEGEKVGVNSTPTFYINGHPIRGYSSFEPFKQLIDEMLAGKHAS
jgi:protein-disulfide isomerase